MNYYIDGTQTTTYVNYKLLDGTGKIIKDYVNEACFSQITYVIIPDGVEVVHIYHDKSKLPYKVPEIKRWIADITEMGFAASFIDDASPTDTEKQKVFAAATVQTDLCEIAAKVLRHGHEEPMQAGPDNYYHFEVRLKDYTYKSHFVSGLMLVRCLTETGICKVPEIYFQMMDANPHQDKFDALQTAHKSVKVYKNTNHMITFDGNGTNVDRQTLLANYQLCGVKVTEHTGYNIGQSVKWHGNALA